MLVFEFTVQDSEDTKVNGKPTREYVNRKMFTNACLWEGALYTYVQIMKAIGEGHRIPEKEGELDVNDDPEFYLGRQLLVRRAVDGKAKQKNPDNPDYWIACRGFAPYGETKNGSQTSSTPADASLLP